MSYSPISLLVPQFTDSNGNPYSGAVLKAYAAGTSNNIAMATDAAGGTTFTSIALNSSGYPSHSGSVVIPHANQNYKIALYPNQTAADSDSSAIWTADDLAPIIVDGEFVLEDSSLIGAPNVITITHKVDGTPAIGIGAGLGFKVETADDNIEEGMAIQTVSTDVGAGTETFDFVVKLKRAGAALAEKLRVTSSGVVKLFGQIQWLKGADVASAATLPVLTDGNYFDVAGTTTITSINAIKVGTLIKLHFDESLTLTHHATDLILPTGANITTAAGDEAEFVEYAAGDWRCTNYTRADGTPLSVNIVADLTPELGGSLNGHDNTVSRVNLLDYSEAINAIGSTGGGTQDIDLELGNYVTATVDTSTNTFTFSNPSASACGFTLVLTNGGSQTVNWPSSVDWPGGSAPSLTASGVDKIVFETTDAGTTWVGNLIGLNYA